jgi:hypothetical protein
MSYNHRLKEGKPNYEFWAAEESVHALLSMLLDLNVITPIGKNKDFENFTHVHTGLTRYIYRVQIDDDER